MKYTENKLCTKLVSFTKFICVRADIMMVQILEITYLTACRTDPFENLIAAYLLKKFKAFYGTRRFT